MGWELSHREFFVLVLLSLLVDEWLLVLGPGLYVFSGWRLAKIYAHFGIPSVVLSQSHTYGADFVESDCAHQFAALGRGDCGESAVASGPDTD